VVAQMVQQKQQADAQDLRTQQIQNAGNAAQSMGEAVKSFQGGQGVAAAA
jgi:hypothetical protein